MDGQIFESVQNIRYLDALTSSKNLVHDELKSSIAASNRRFYSLEQILHFVWSQGYSS